MNIILIKSFKTVLLQIFINRSFQLKWFSEIIPISFIFRNLKKVIVIKKVGNEMVVLLKNLDR